MTLGGNLPPLLPYADIAMIRHGRSITNADRSVIQGSGPHPSNTLDNVGEGQARGLAGTLLNAGIMPVAVRSSPFRRARQTCHTSLDIMGYGELPVVEDSRLQELCKGLPGLPGGLEGRPRNEVETDEYWQRYHWEGWDFRFGSVASKGETPREVGTRVMAALNDFADHLASRPMPLRLGWQPAGLAYMHGYAIRYGIGAVLGWPDIRRLDRLFDLKNCHGVVLRRYHITGYWAISSLLTPYVE